MVEIIKERINEMVLSGADEIATRVVNAIHTITEDRISLDKALSIMEKYGYDSDEFLSVYDILKERTFGDGRISLTYHADTKDYTLVLLVIDK